MNYGHHSVNHVTALTAKEKKNTLLFLNIHLPNKCYSLIKKIPVSQDIARLTSERWQKAGKLGRDI